MTISLTVDRKNGKVYFAHDKIVGWRICFFYVAVDVFYKSIDVILKTALDKIDKLREAGL